MIRFLFSLMIVGAFCVPASGQLDTLTTNTIATAVTAEYHAELLAQDEVAEAETPFHRQVIIVGRKMVRDGSLKRADMVALRVAMFSPAFRAHCENVSVIQMSASGVESDQAPIGDDGKINRAGINWEGLTAFLEKMIPIFLTLAKAFGWI